MVVDLGAPARGGRRDAPGCPPPAACSPGPLEHHAKLVTSLWPSACRAGDESATVCPCLGALPRRGSSRSFQRRGTRDAEAHVDLQSSAPIVLSLSRSLFCCCHITRACRTTALIRFLQTAAALDTALSTRPSQVRALRRRRAALLGTAPLQADTPASVTSVYYARVGLSLIHI